ncbi:MAG TPA: YdcF family protein [Rubrivivax sp.]|uniref:YdcF family protein n=1 Tax=Kouleothrix sp. TaxID=2779161 RepID=UPI002D1673C2|nr:YdcF family protein [Rubrivivax sp.]HRY89651.1 YdcF family protein [Rubrivivax sp.]HRZ60092.1 YdcF family protein [Rubrivivax sp.]
MLNDWLTHFDLLALKPVATALLLPPVPWLALMLGGGWVLRRRPAWQWSCLLLGAAGIWLCSTTGVGQMLQRRLTAPHQALSAQDIQALRRSGPGAIVVLGSGREAYAPEYGGPNPGPMAAERLRYGIWLGRETGWPVAYSGGIGHAGTDGPTEADAAALAATRDFGRPLRWAEGESRDTRENAERSVALLQAAGVKRIVLVTHGFHMRRSLRAFEQAVQRRGAGIALVPAPMGLADDDVRGVLRWLPSAAGMRKTNLALHEYLGLLAGA